MRILKSLTLAAAALGTFEYAGTGTPLATVQTAQAQALPAVWQRKVQKLAQNINKSRQTLAARGATDLQDSFKTKQWRDRIANYKSSLAKVPATNDAVMATATEQLALLEKEFAALAAGGGASTATTATQPETGGQSSGTATAAPAQAAQPASGPQLVSGQRVRVKKLARDMANVMGDIVVTGPSPMQSGEVVGKYNKRMKQFADALGRYAEFKGDPDVRQAAGNYNALIAAVTKEYNRAQEQKKQLGDVQARLAGIEKALRDNQPTTSLVIPFTDADAKAWVQELATAQQTAQKSAAELQSIAPLAYLPENRGVVQSGAPYDNKDLDRLYRFANDTVAKVNNSIEGVQQALKTRFDSQDQIGLKYFRELDPDDDHARANAYLAEGAEARILGRLDEQMALAESVAAYQRGFGKEPTANTKARIEEIAALRKKYLEDRIEVLGNYTLPDPASTDAERIAIAEKILANPEYEFGEHGPVVLTTEEIVTREKEVSRDTIKDVDVSLSGTITWSGTRETWNYKWDEFKFATPLKDESGDWYVWWITAKKYESGWERTPIGYWVSGQTTKGSLILEENFR